MKLNDKILKFKHTKTGLVIEVPLMTLLIGSGTYLAETETILTADVVDEQYELIK